MSLSRKIQNLAARSLLSDRTRDGLRAIQRTRRNLKGQTRQVEYFHQVDDPYACLASQILGKFSARYEIDLKIYLVGAPPTEAAPDPERLIAYSRLDAAAIATAMGLSFHDPGQQPSAENVRRASEILAANLDPKQFCTIAPQVGAALWENDTDGILDLANEYATASEEELIADRERGSARRAKLGHYNSATFYFEGEWYWGVDRLHYLEERLLADGARRESGTEPLIAPPEISTEPVTNANSEIILEYFPSLRSPYSAISTERTFALAERLPIDLVLKPVLPMVMRGMQVPTAKRIYIVRDTKREANRLGLAFGNSFDPVGKPVEQAFSLYPFAKQKGRGKEFLASFLTSSFAGGIDTGSEDGLRHVVVEAGLSWEEARPQIGGTQWQEELARNREEMLDAGLWGVPSYRVRSPGEPDFAIWGQDRLWLVDREIRRRLDKENAG